MDKNYLEHIVGSHHVDEGLYNRIVARGMAGLQKVDAMTGGALRPDQVTEIHSLYVKFLNKIIPVLQDFSVGKDNVADRLDQMPQGFAGSPTPQQKAIIQKLRELYTQIVPELQQHQLSKAVRPYDPADTERSDKPYVPEPTNRERFVRDVPRKREKLSEIIEGVFGRGLALNKAIASNDATTIINAYMNKVKSIYDSFINDASKVTKYPPEYIVRTMSKVDKKHTEVLKSVRDIVHPEQAHIPTETPTAPTTPAPSPESPVTTTSPATTGPTAPTTDVPAMTSKSKLQAAANDFIGGILAQALKVFISEVKSDRNRSKAYFEKPYTDPVTKQTRYYLPTAPEEPKVSDPEWSHTPDYKPTAKEAPPQVRYEPVKNDAGEIIGWNHKQIAPTPSVSEADVPATAPVPTSSTSTPDTSLPLDDEDRTDEFIYDFASKFNKYPGGTTIDVTKKGGISFTLPSSKQQVVMEVMWSWIKHENTIKVSFRNSDSNTWSKGDILKFWDDQILVSSPSYNVNIKLFLSQVDRRMASYWDLASNEARAEVNKYMGELKPSLYVIGRHKSMEFTSKDLTIMLDQSDGSVIMRDRTGKNTRTLGSSEITAGVESDDPKTRARWINKLVKIGYYDRHGIPVPPVIKPVKSDINISDVAAAQEALEALNEKNPDVEIDMTDIMQTVINSLGASANKDEYFIECNFYLQQKIASEELSKDGMNQVDIRKYVPLVSKTISKQDITADIIVSQVKRAVAKPTPPAATPTPPAAPAATPTPPAAPASTPEAPPATEAAKLEYLSKITNGAETVKVLTDDYKWEFADALNGVISVVTTTNNFNMSVDEMLTTLDSLNGDDTNASETPSPAPLKNLSWDKENVDWTKGGKSYKISQLLAPAFGYPPALVKDMEASGIFKDHPEIKSDIEKKDAVKKTKPSKKSTLKTPTHDPKTGKPYDHKKKKTEMINPFQKANFL